MHPQGGASTRERAWQPTSEVAEAIRRAAAAFAGRKGAVSVLNRGGRSALQGLRIAICDDSPIFLSGLAAALVDVGVASCRQALDVQTLEWTIAQGGVDAAIIDLAQPPSYRVEGLAAAQRIRASRPAFPIVLLSSNVDSEAEQVFAALRHDFAAMGYVRKDRLAGGVKLEDVLTLVLEGGTVVDSDLVNTLMSATADDPTLSVLSGRERQTLALVAQGLTNAAIAREMFLSPKTVETNIASLFNKLGLPVEESANRRVLATLTYLRAERTPPATTRGEGHT